LVLSGLFESDQDLDTVCSLVEELGFETDSWEFTLSSMVYHTDMLAPTESRALYETPEYSNHLANTIVPYLRNKLDIPCKNGTSLQLGWLTTIESEYSITAAQVSFFTVHPLKKSMRTDCVSSTRGIPMLGATVRVFGSTFMFAWAFKRVLLPPMVLGPRELISVIFGISGCPLNILTFPRY
jgi:hypothetical protein